ncbi:corticotropin-releasing factor receptor 1 [Puma concolor]|uniref:Corticotropin-releasing factor receptor 1 n=1 Tax=Puma concolor TaxID=9696 RepID=A0A6P6HZJ1_PUMCO|nr:corticotropin-releasing factor receptor 1 [Puma concolor]
MRMPKVPGVGCDARALLKWGRRGPSGQLAAGRELPKRSSQLHPVPASIPATACQRVPPTAANLGSGRGTAARRPEQGRGGEGAEEAKGERAEGEEGGTEGEGGREGGDTYEGRGAEAGSCADRRGGAGRRALRVRLESEAAGPARAGQERRGRAGLRSWGGTSRHLGAATRNLAVAAPPQPSTAGRPLWDVPGTQASGTVTERARGWDGARSSGSPKALLLLGLNAISASFQDQPCESLSLASNISGLQCNASVDLIGTCWPRSPAGQLVVRPCPAYFYGVRYNTTSKEASGGRTICRDNGYRECLANGSWAARVNYSECQEILSGEKKSKVHYHVAVIINYLGHCVSLVALLVAFVLFLRLSLSPGVPFPIIVAWAIGKLYYDNEKCWFGKRPGVYTDYIYQGPMILVLLINFIFLFNIVRILMTKLRASTTSETIQYRKAVKATLVLLPLLGITYMLFFVNPGEDEVSRVVFIYFNSFLESFQGFFVSVFYCFLNSEVRSAVRKRWHRWQDKHSIRARVARAMSIPTSPTRVSFHSIKPSTAV